MAGFALSLDRNLDILRVSTAPVEVSFPERGGETMPTYTFKCQKCDETFEEILSFKEYQEQKRKCPKCSSARVEQVLETFFAKTSRKA
jgi:putative FmdB family regulatory protein